MNAYTGEIDHPFGDAENRGVTNHNISGQIDHPNYGRKIKLIVGKV
jgi:hypothetical protein